MVATTSKLCALRPSEGVLLFDYKVKGCLLIELDDHLVFTSPCEDQ